MTTSTVVTITASLNGGSIQATLTVNPFFASFSAAPSTVVGGQGTTMTLDLTANVVSNTTATFSSTSNAVTVPASLQISSGQSSATSWITSSPVSQATTATITATVGGFTTTTTVTVNPAPVLSVTLNSNSLTGGSGTMGTVTLGAAAGPSGDVVTLVGGNTAVSIPSSVNIQSGATTGNFSVSTSAVSGTVNVTISAALGSSVKATTLTLNPAEVSAFSLSSNTVVGGSTVYGNVVLASAAGASGDEVQLASGNSAVTLPSAVLVPAGQTSVGFKVNSSAVASATPVNLTATFGGSFQLTTLTVNPAVSSLTLNQNSLNGGAGTTGKVTLAVQATGPEVVSLKSGNSAVSVTPSVTVVAGSSSAQILGIDKCCRRDGECHDFRPTRRFIPNDDPDRASRNDLECHSLEDDSCGRHEHNGDDHALRKRGGIRGFDCPVFRRKRSHRANRSSCGSGEDDGHLYDQDACGERLQADLGDGDLREFE